MTLRSGEESPTARVDAEADALDWDDDSTPKASVRPIETGEHLMPLVPVSTEPEEERVEGETFHERMTRLAVPESSSARGVLREEFSEAAAAEKEAAFHDEDGAICFEGQSGEGRTVRYLRMCLCQAERWFVDIGRLAIVPTGHGALTAYPYDTAFL